VRAQQVFTGTELADGMAMLGASKAKDRVCVRTKQVFRRCCRRMTYKPWKVALNTLVSVYVAVSAVMRSTGSLRWSNSAY